jgi:cullin-5
VNLCSNPDDKLQIYKENFEKAYLDATSDFYKIKAPDYLEANGVHAYMRYADLKLREEEARAQKYLESSKSVDLVSPLKYILHSLVCEWYSKLPH